MPPRPAGVGELISEVFNLWSAHVMTLWRLNVIAQAPYAIVIAAAPLVTGFANAQARIQSLTRVGGTPPLSDLSPLLGTEASYFLVVLLAALLVTPILTAPILHATAEIMWGRRVTVSAAYGAARRAYGRLVVQAVVVSLVVIGIIAASSLVVALLGVGLGVVMHQFALLVVIPLALALGVGFICLVIYINVRYALGPAAVVLESAGAMNGLHRSSDLTRGRFWTTFVVQLVAGLPVVGYALIAGLASGIGGLGGPAGPYIAQGLVAALLLPVVFPLSGVAHVVLYAEYRRREVAANPPQTEPSLG